MANNLKRKQITKLPANLKSCFNYCVQYFKTRNVRQFEIKVISHGTTIFFWMFYYAAKPYTGWNTSKTGMFLCSTKMWSLTEQSTHTLYPVKMQRSISRISHQAKLPIIIWFMSIKLKTDISVFQVFHYNLTTQEWWPWIKNLITILLKTAYKIERKKWQSLQSTVYFLQTIQQCYVSCMFIYGLLKDGVTSSSCVVCNGRIITEKWNGKVMEVGMV